MGFGAFKSLDRFKPNTTFTFLVQIFTACSTPICNVLQPNIHISRKTLNFELNFTVSCAVTGTASYLSIIQGKL